MKSYNLVQQEGYNRNGLDWNVKQYNAGLSLYIHTVVV